MSVMSTHSDPEEDRALGELELSLAETLSGESAAAYVASLGGVRRCLLRWLRTTHLDVPLAERRFLETLKWREEVKANGCLENPEMCALADRFAPLWPASYRGSTNDGLSVLFCHAGQLQPYKIMAEFTPDEAIRFAVWWLETSSARQREILAAREAIGLSSADCRGQLEIYDLTGLSFSQMHIPAIRLLAQITGLWARHYPENLQRGFIINAPMVFSIAWQIILPTLGEPLNKRISVHRDGAERELLEYLSAERLAAVAA